MHHEQPGKEYSFFFFSLENLNDVFTPKCLVQFKSSQVKSQIIYFEHEKCVCHMILKDNDNNNDRRVIQHNNIVMARKAVFVCVSFVMFTSQVRFWW